MARKGYKQTPEHIEKRIAGRLTTLASKPKPVSREYLKERYSDQRLDCIQIGTMLGYDPKTIWSWLRYYGIPTRPRGGATSPAAFRKGQRNAFAGCNHSAETRAKLRKSALADGRVPFNPEVGSYMKGRKGPDTTNWKGGITPERQGFYASEEWRDACKIVWARSNACCERCGKHHNASETRGTFHIHHITSFAVRELRGEPANLRLLCNHCHRFIHSKGNLKRELLKEII